MKTVQILDYLKQSISSIEPVPDELVEDLFAASELVSCPKGSFFVMAGEKPRHMGFNINGIFRLFYTDKSGNDSTKGFCTPGKLVVSYSAMVQSRESFFSIEAITDCDILRFSYLKWMSMAEKDSRWYPFLFKLVESVYIMKEMREKSFLLENASERYLNFLAAYPGLDRKIKQYHVASFLGISPEALSRIKKDLKLI